MGDFTWVTLHLTAIGDIEETNRYIARIPPKFIGERRARACERCDVSRARAQ
jgi:hypothetical protein